MDRNKDRAGGGGGRGPESGDGDFLRRALERARGLLELGRPRAALAEIFKALSASGDASAGSGGPLAEALQLVGLCHIRLDELPAARKALESAVASDPSDAHGHYLLGYAHSESRLTGSPGEAAGGEALKQALVCYREALRLRPDQPVYLRALAEALVVLKRFTEALELAHKAVALGPDRASNHITLGYVASSAGNRTLARQAYQQALVIDPNNALAWNNLGCVDLAQGRVLHARERFREALRLDPAGGVAQDNYKLVKPRRRPPAVYQDFAACERQLVVEVWESVLFTGRPLQLTEEPPPVSGPPLSPLGFLKNYLNPFPKLRQKEDPRLHAAALLGATGWRALPAVWWRAPSVLTWLGVSVGLLRLGPAGAALALSSGAAAVLLARAPIRQRQELYQRQLVTLKERWERAYAEWLAGAIARHQRDEVVDRLLDEFCCFVEALRDRPPSADAPPTAPESPP